MSRSSLFQLKANVQTDRLRLLPEGPLNLNLSLRFDSGGVLDFEDAVDQVIGGLESHMGKLKSVSTADRDSIKAQLAPCIVEQAINSIPDVLGAFDNDGEQYWDDELRLHMPLRMKGSGYKVDLIVKFLQDGSLDLDHMIESLESAYSDVLKGVVS